MCQAVGIRLSLPCDRLWGNARCLYENVFIVSAFLNYWKEQTLHKHVSSCGLYYFFVSSTNHLNGQLFSLQSIYFKSRAFQGRTVSSILVLCHLSNWLINGATLRLTCLFLSSNNAKHLAVPSFLNVRICCFTLSYMTVNLICFFWTACWTKWATRRHNTGLLLYLYSFFWHFTDR